MALVVPVIRVQQARQILAVEAEAAVMTLPEGKAVPVS